MQNKMMTDILYKLLQKPLGFKPYDELVADVWGNVMVKLKDTEQ
ncbi:hypothetical protein NYE67_08800 [Solibacillus sp. FSL W8-0474]